MATFAPPAVLRKSHREVLFFTLNGSSHAVSCSFRAVPVMFVLGSAAATLEPVYLIPLPRRAGQRHGQEMFRAGQATHGSHPRHAASHGRSPLMASPGRTHPVLQMISSSEEVE
ncbi:hypothetical protein [Rhodovastum atsumiense]|uniref:Uncharacterized protein n=1 Tax=Rhodovastum atsumiense TaxID=504468 RepID=A0A5M6IR00_9PROT|nr:hypothetical protein [Rhodovastum atsumiense]KAA5610714.1 hypothetical protein F1189_18250 [Rhodovastum atsumiense]